jgi:hypothetical protein
MVKFNFFTTPDFDKSFKKLGKKYPSLSDDILMFQEALKKNPKAGIDLGSGFRKVRAAIKSKGKGKSGSARIITYDLVISIKNHDILLVYMYDKSDFDTVDINILKDLVKKNQ